MHSADNHAVDVNQGIAASESLLLSVSQNSLNDIRVNGCNPQTKDFRPAAFGDVRGAPFPEMDRKLGGDLVGRVGDNNMNMFTSDYCFSKPFVNMPDGARSLRTAGRGDFRSFSADSSLEAMEAASFAQGTEPSAPVLVASDKPYRSPVHYGSAPRPPPSCSPDCAEFGLGSLPACIWNSFAGVINDIMHYDSITPEIREQYNAGDNVSYILFRDNRGVYLSILVLFLVVLFLVILTAFSGDTQARQVVYLTR